MKRKVILLSLVLMMLAVGVVSAAANWGKFEGYNIVKLVIDGKTVAVEDTPPVILKGRTMVPLSMLKQAGVDATWDGDTYTVNVETSIDNNSVTEDDIIHLKTLFLVSDLYKRINDLGDSISGLSRSFSLAFEEINDTGKNDYLSTSYNHLDGYINLYNENVDYLNSTSKSFSDAGINMNKAHDVLDYYFDAIEYYKKSISALDRYSQTFSNYDFDNYLNNSSEGFKLSFEGIEISDQEYTKIKSRILQY